jgi:hypothetical protein
MKPFCYILGQMDLEYNPFAGLWRNHISSRNSVKINHIYFLIRYLPTRTRAACWDEERYRNSRFYSEKETTLLQISLVG